MLKKFTIGKEWNGVQIHPDVKIRMRIFANIKLEIHPFLQFVSFGKFPLIRTIKIGLLFFIYGS